MLFQYLPQKQFYSYKKRIKTSTKLVSYFVPEQSFKLFLMGVSAMEYSIDFKEWFAIVAAVMIWGSLWEGKRIVLVTDNFPHTQIWHIGTSRSSNIMVLVRILATQFGFSVSLILGIHNPVADALPLYMLGSSNNWFQIHRKWQQLPLAVAEHIQNIPHAQ